MFSDVDDFDDMDEFHDASENKKDEVSKQYRIAQISSLAKMIFVRTFTKDNCDLPAETVAESSIESAKKYVDLEMEWIEEEGKLDK